MARIRYDPARRYNIKKSNVPVLIQIATALRGLMWKVRDAESLISTTVTGMAGAVQGIASTDSRARSPAEKKRQMGGN